MPNNFPKAIPDIKQSMKTISMFLRSKAIMFLLLFSFVQRVKRLIKVQSPQ